MNSVNTLEKIGVPMMSVTPNELQEFVRSCEKIKDDQLANMGVLFKSKQHTFEMDERLYNALINNPNPTDELLYRYEKIQDSFVESEQLKELYKVNPVKWPYAPTRIITVKGVNPQIDNIVLGLRLAPFQADDKSLGHISKKEYMHLLKCIRDVIDSTKCYADNEVAHKHIFEAPSHRNRKPKFNVIQNEDGASIIGAYGPLVSVGKDFNAEEAQIMHTNVAELINYYTRVYGLPIIQQPSENITEQTLEEMYKYFSDGVIRQGRK